ncbi:hypothetical protein DRO54_00335 [Candidatus Bathyarchaeota archaeon]|nr:MAG: hypothetical protein DRO54_00335 [Candidatus Bathyarchaeota archaeon]
MGVLDRLFKRKKKGEEEEIEKTSEKEREITDLEKLCSDSPETFEALKDTMFLDPRKIDTSFEDAISKAKELEKAKDNLRAAVWYRIAGGLAIYEGNVSRVKECFDKYAKLTGTNLKILEIPEEAVKKAHEYYEKYLKDKEGS